MKKEREPQGITIATLTHYRKRKQTKQPHAQDEGGHKSLGVSPLSNQATETSRPQIEADHQDESARTNVGWQRGGQSPTIETLSLVSRISQQTGFTSRQRIQQPMMPSRGR
jgi:hypothetical protein